MFDLFNQPTQEEKSLQQIPIGCNTKSKKTIAVANSPSKNLKHVWATGAFDDATFKKACNEIIDANKKYIGKPFYLGANVYICMDVLPFTPHKGGQMLLDVCIRCQYGKIYTLEEVKFA